MSIFKNTKSLQFTNPDCFLCNYSADREIMAKHILKNYESIEDEVKSPPLHLLHTFKGQGKYTLD